MHRLGEKIPNSSMINWTTVVLLTNLLTQECRMYCMALFREQWRMVLFHSQTMAKFRIKCGSGIDLLSREHKGKDSLFFCPEMEMSTLSIITVINEKNKKKKLTRT